MNYWVDQPGIGVNIVDKLLNYTILTPLSVVQWALDGTLDGSKLVESYVFEMVTSTVTKVTHRIRQIVASRTPDLSEEERKEIDEMLVKEREAMKEMFAVMEEALSAWATGSKDQSAEQGDGVTEDADLVRRWGERWGRVFRRKIAVEEAWAIEVGNKEVREKEERERGEALAKNESMVGVEV
jgi:nuclear cap-binding protein subunit 1